MAKLFSKLYIYLLLFIFNFSVKSSAQSNTFKLDYFAFSFFPFSEVYLPTVSIDRDTLLYRIAAKNGKYKLEYIYMDTIHNKSHDTIWAYDTITHKIKIRQTSIDSIVSIMSTIKEDSIFGSNFCIIDGVNYSMKIEYNKRKLLFGFMNTQDSNCIAIIKIFNNYLPRKNRFNIQYYEKEIADAAKCEQGMENWRDKKKHKKQRSK